MISGYVGNTRVEKIYLGADVIWPTTPPEPSVYTNMPFTIEITSGGTLNFVTKLTGNGGNRPALKLDFYKNGALLQSIDDTGGTTYGTNYPMTGLVAGDKIEVMVPSGITETTEPTNLGTGWAQVQSNANYWTFSGSTAGFMVYGNALSLLSNRYSGNTMYQDIGITAATNSNNYVTSSTTTMGLTVAGVFAGLLRGCSGLTDASNLMLPTDFAPISGYLNMFKGSTALVNPPKLLAESVERYSYTSMFDGCSSMTNLTCLINPTSKIIQNVYPQDINLFYWVKNVADSGTFYRYPGVTWPIEDYDGVPINWTIVDYNQ